MPILTRETINAAEAIREEKAKYPHSFKKILVGGFDVECWRWNKIVHIHNVHRIPTVHEDGRVTIRAFNKDWEVEATRVTLNSTGQSWVSYDIA